MQFQVPKEHETLGTTRQEIFLEQHVFTIQYWCKYVVGLVGVHRLTCWHDHVHLITSINYSYITCLRLKKENQCVQQGKEKEQEKERQLIMCVGKHSNLQTMTKKQIPPGPHRAEAGGAQFPKAGARRRPWNNCERTLYSRRPLKGTGVSIYLKNKCNPHSEIGGVGTCHLVMQSW